MSTLESVKTITIRPLTIEELPLCVPFGEAFHKEKDMYGLFSGEMFIKSWTKFITYCNGAIFGMWIDDELVGGIGGMVAEEFSSVEPDTLMPVITATHFFLYLTPEHRIGNRWIHLVDRFREFGKSKGATRFHAGAYIVKGVEFDRTARVLAYKYNKMGLQAMDFGFGGPI